MTRLLLDTSMWLDIAKRRDGQRLVVPLRVFAAQGRLELLVPQVVVDEFTRNRPRVEASVTAAVKGRFKELRRDLHEYGDGSRQDWLEEMSYHIPIVSAAALQNFREIDELLRGGQILEPGRVEYERTIKRGLDKRAPLHRNKNSVADALLIALFVSQVENAGESDRLAFATLNFEDFSEHNGDRRLPHPDIAPIFNDTNSRYLYSVDALHAVLVDWFGDEYGEMAEEFDVIHDEPRTLSEILEAEREFFDKVWYVRTLILDEKVKRGEQEPLDNEILKGRDSNLKRIEDEYGVDELGPWDDWEWGFVNGKLSALRWAWCQVVVATLSVSSFMKTSRGVWKLRVLRGRSLSSSAMAVR